ncbi:hypothetical protein [Paractinoplanes maris]|uniref:hypothetical protein n=1 Tax=Paractinoplanes maris TaxID=1734446 RepID=UPI00202180DA|nr:hypothetical protein [Actinoplanes maris]
MEAGLKRELEAKVHAGERLSRADGVALFGCDDLAWLGRLAHHRRTELNGDRVTFTGAAPAGAGGDRVATMVYGHLEDYGDRVDELLRLRERQDETGDVLAFRPLRRETGSGDRATEVAPVESLKMFAVSRLLLDNIAHVTCSWDTHTLSIAQLTMNFGADDLDGSGDRPERDDLVELIGDAGFQPVERDEDYAVVRAYDRAPSLAERRSQPQKVWA